MLKVFLQNAKKVDIDVPYFMIEEHAVCVFLNTSFGFKVVKT